jgi:hypothetical protein
MLVSVRYRAWHRRPYKATPREIQVSSRIKPFLTDPPDLPSVLLTRTLTHHPTADAFQAFLRRCRTTFLKATAALRRISEDRQLIAYLHTRRRPRCVPTVIQPHPPLKIRRIFHWKRRQARIHEIDVTPPRQKDKTRLLLAHLYLQFRKRYTSLSRGAGPGRPAWSNSFPLRLFRLHCVLQMGSPEVDL